MRVDVESVTAALEVVLRESRFDFASKDGVFLLENIADPLSGQRHPALVVGGLLADPFDDPLLSSEQLYVSARATCHIQMSF